ncbi:MAG TPA: septum formation initiator family protein [Acidimicrobiales bacterium]|nr:septum formation initiator family protein [Acidimicrobiales bacterium]
MRIAVRLLLGAVVVVGILFLFVFPTRTLLEQDRQISVTQRQISLLQRENGVLSRRAAALDNPSAVERIAREQYGLVRPGQKEYIVLPAASGHK